jgi:replicative DNA helicase
MSLAKEQLPPHDLKAEMTVLSEVMTRPGTIDDVLGVLRPDDFYSEAHRRIFEACLEVYAEHRHIDMPTVGAWLKSHDRLKQVGGAEYIAQIYHDSVAVTTVVPIARIVRDHSRVRQFMDAARLAVAKCFLEPHPNIIVEFARLCADLADDRIEQAAKPIRDAMHRAAAQMKAAVEHKGISGMSTGLVDLDKMTSGMHDGDLIVVAGRPGMGKSALAFQILAHVAGTGAGTLGFSMEMPDEQIAMRLACERAHISIEKARGGYINKDSEWSAMIEASIAIAALPAFLDDRPALNLAQIRSSARRTQRTLVGQGNKLRLLVVDYLQLARHASAQSREQEVAEISRGLKELAKELSLPIIALAQLNRKCEERSDKRPLLSDLRDSGTIEQDADCIIFIYRDELYRQNSPDRGIAELIVGKQRNGPLGRVPAAFNAEYTSFADLDDESKYVWETRKYE